MSGDILNTVEGYSVLNFDVASLNNFRDIKKIIISRRRRRKSTIALSENAFAFRLKIEIRKSTR